MILDRMTQKQRREIMKEHGHQNGIALEYFGKDGKPIIFIQTFGTEAEMSEYVKLHNKQMKRWDKEGKL